MYGVAEGCGREGAQGASPHGGGARGGPRGRGAAGEPAGAARALAQRLRHLLHHVPDVARVQHRADRRLALP